MKKVKITLVSLATLFVGVSNVQAQVVEEGNILVDVYAGYGTAFNALFRTAYQGANSDSKLSAIDAIGVRGEYLLSDKFGIGLDLTFSSIKLVDPYTTTVNTYDQNGLVNGSTVQSFEQTYSSKKIGGMISMNYHFLDNDKFDAYTNFGVGYKNRSYKYESTDPTATTQELGVGTLIPIALRAGVGVRYFFTDNIGLNMNIGLGQGGWLNGGVSAKF
jgi:opacity protein-like surface antigen